MGLEDPEKNLLRIQGLTKAPNPQHCIDSEKSERKKLID
jgi:hypothetical protein